MCLELESPAASTAGSSLRFPFKISREHWSHQMRVEVVISYLTKIQIRGMFIFSYIRHHMHEMWRTFLFG